MIKPNVLCKVFVRTGYDAYGAAKYSAGTSAKCLVIKFINKTDREIVRVDSGASRGSGKEEKAQVTLLFLPATKINAGDKVEMLGEFLQVLNTNVRFNTAGRHDHNEVDLSIWQSE